MQKKTKLDKELSQSLASQDMLRLTHTISELEQITPYEESELVRWSAAQEELKNHEEAVRLLNKLSIYSPRWYLLYLPKQMKIMEDNQMDIKKYILKKREDFASFPFSKKEKRELNDICMDYTKKKCID